ncbi:c7fc8f79-a5be-42d8-b99d-9880fa400cad [Thermothielavioides terrestris]|jgi:hypothetical protein
MVLG